jgi:hypothetical protein
MEVRPPSALPPRSCNNQSHAGEPRRRSTAACMSSRRSLPASLLISHAIPRDEAATSQEIDIHDRDDRARHKHASSSLFISASPPLSLSPPPAASLPSRLPHPPGHLLQSSSPSATTSLRSSPLAGPPRRNPRAGILRQNALAEAPAPFAVLQTPRPRGG